MDKQEEVKKILARGNPDIDETANEICDLFEKPEKCPECKGTGSIPRVGTNLPKPQTSEQELQGKIGKLILPYIESAGFDGLDSIARTNVLTHQILSLLKQAGYVKLAKEQTLPYIPPDRLAPFKGYQIQQDMLAAGWRKVEE